MSVSVVKNNIVMIRSDTLRVKINITDSNGESYIPIEGDKIVFAAKKDYRDAESTLEERLEAMENAMLEMILGGTL